MAEITNLEQKINSYLISHKDMKGKSEAVILSAMQKEGIVTQAEIDSVKKTSAFGFGFNNQWDMGLAIESTSPDIEVPYVMTKEEREVAEQQRVANEKKIGEVQNHIRNMYEMALLKAFIPGAKDYESGKKIKTGENEKSIEQFIKEDLNLDITSEEGINTYAQLLYIDEEDMQKKDVDQIKDLVAKLNLDLTKETGREVFMRLMQFDSEALQHIDNDLLTQTLKFLGKKELTFNDAADVLEQQGLIIRNKEEFEATNIEREKRNNRNFIASLMTLVYNDQLDKLYNEYADSKDATTVRFWSENIKEAMYKAGFTFDDPTLDVAMSNTHNAKAKVQVLNNLAINEDAFNRYFKETFGVEYNDEKLSNVIKSINESNNNNNGINFNDPKVKAALQDFFTYDVNGDFEHRQKTNEIVDGFLGTLFMVGTMGFASELQALNQAAKGFKGAQAMLQASSTLGATNAANQFILKNITTNPAARAVLFGGLNFGVYSAGTTGMHVLANIQDAKLADVNTVAESFCQSFLFGAFAAEFGMGAGIVSNAVKNGVNKQVNIRIMKPVIEKFAKKPVMSGNEFIQTLLTNESKIASAAAKTVNFGLEVAGFSGYEMAMTAMNGGKPKNMSTSEYLQEVLTSQFKTLGEFKIAGFIMNSRMATRNMPKATRKLLSNPKLENMEIRAINNNGKVSYLVKDVQTGESKVYKNLKGVRNRCIEIMNEPTPLDRKLQELSVGEKLELDLGEEKLVFEKTKDGVKIYKPVEEARVEEPKIEEVIDEAKVVNEELKEIKAQLKQRPYEQLSTRQFEQAKAQLLKNYKNKQLDAKNPLDFLNIYFSNAGFSTSEVESILKSITKQNIEVAEYFLKGDEVPSGLANIMRKLDTPKVVDFAKELCANKEFSKNQISDIISSIKEINVDLAKSLLADKDFPQEQVQLILCYTNETNIDIAKIMCADKDFPKEEIVCILPAISEINVEFAKMMCIDKDFPKEEIAHILYFKKNIELAKLMYAEKFPPKCITLALNSATETSINVYNKIKNDDTIPTKFKAAIISSGREDLVDSIPKLMNQYNNMLKNPEKYVNGEMSADKAIENIKFFFNSSIVDILKISDSLDKEALDNLFRRRLDDVRDYIVTTRGFSDADFDLLKQISNACNVDGKPFMPTQKVEMIDLIQAYKDCGFDTSKLLPVDGRVDLGQAKIDLFSHVMELSGLTKEEIASIPKEKLVAWDTTYAHLMAQEIEEPAMRDLVRAANFDDFERYIHDKSNEYGVANARTQELFRTNEMDYDAWLHPSKSNELTFRTMDANHEKLIQISDQLVEDIEVLRQNPGVKGFIDKQFPKCIKEGKFIVPSEYLTSKERLNEFTENILKQLEGVWKRAEKSAENPDPERAAKGRNTLTIRDHLNQRIADISTVEAVAQTKSFDVTIKMWDRNPQKDIFQGNYSTCCIGMGGGNGSAMPHYLLDTAYNMIELVDNNTGKTIGNALCYFVTGSDGQPKFIIDNIEINNGVKPSAEVGRALRQQMVNYANNVAREVTGRDDIEIFMSGSYNDVPTADLRYRQDQVTFLGETDCDNIYMDLYKGWVDHDNDAAGKRAGSYTRRCNLFELVPERDPQTEALIQARKELADMRGWNNKDAKFTSEEVQMLAPVYAKNPEATRIALNRFTPEEVIQYKDYLDELNELSALDSGKKPQRFTHDEVLALAQTYKTHKEQVLRLAETKKSAGGYYSVYERFSADEIAVLAPVYTKETAGLIETLGHMRSLYSEVSDRFSGKQIRAIIEHVDPKNLAVLNEFAKTNIVDRMDADKFIEYVIKNQDVLPQLVELSNMNLRGYDRFHTPEEILAYMQNLKQYPDATRTLILMTEYNGKTPRFNAKEINALAPVYAKNPEATSIALKRFTPEEVIRYQDYLIEINELSSIYSHRKDVRFSHDEVLSLATTYRKYRNQVMVLQDATMGGSYYVNHPRFTAEDIRILAPVLTTKNSKAISYLMRVGHHDDAKFRFSATEIKNLVTAFTYKDKNGNVINNADNIVKLLQLDKYKDCSAQDLYIIAQKYESNLGALVELGNIPPVREGINKVKASQTHKVVGTKKIITAEGKEKVVEIKKLNPQIEEQLHILAKHIREDALGVDKEIAEFMKANNLTTDDYEFAHRAKSEQSLFDKLKNYLLDPENKDKTIADAVRSVKDSVGTRTIIPTRDYTQHPEVQALIAKGDREGAVQLAMRLQSEEMVQNLKTLLTKLKEDGVENLGVLRFSNYKGQNGMPYFSHAQLREIKELIDVEFDNLKEDQIGVFAGKGIELKKEHFETQTRNSGYTAFQANFKTKDGHVFEWQFRGDIVNEFAEAEHVPYDLRTDKDIVSANPKAKAILEPIKEILSLEKMTDADFKEYNEYLTAYYKYCRERELGFADAKLEKSFDSNKFDHRLKAENLMLLHEYSEKLKKAEPADIPRLVAEYNSKLIN